MVVKTSRRPLCLDSLRHPPLKASWAGLREVLPVWKSSVLDRKVGNLACSNAD